MPSSPSVRALECPVCLRSIGADCRPVVGKCGHTVCETCRPLLPNGKRCPTCASAASFGEVVVNYACLDSLEKLNELDARIKRRMDQLDVLRVENAVANENISKLTSTLSLKETEITQKSKDLEMTKTDLAKFKEKQNFAFFDYMNCKSKLWEELILARKQKDELLAQLKKKQSLPDSTSDPICSSCAYSMCEKRARVCVTCGLNGGFLKEENGEVIIINLKKIEDSILCGSCLLDCEEHVDHRHTKFLPLVLAYHTSCIMTTYEETWNATNVQAWDKCITEVSKLPSYMSELLTAASHKGRQFSSFSEFEKKNLTGLRDRIIRANEVFMQIMLVYKLECQEITDLLVNFDKISECKQANSAANDGDILNSETPLFTSTLDAKEHSDAKIADDGVTSQDAASDVPFSFNFGEAPSDCSGIYVFASSTPPNTKPADIKKTVMPGDSLSFKHSKIIARPNYRCRRVVSCSGVEDQSDSSLSTSHSVSQKVPAFAPSSAKEKSIVLPKFTFTLVTPSEDKSSTDTSTKPADSKKEEKSSTATSSKLEDSKKEERSSTSSTKLVDSKTECKPVGSEAWITAMVEKLSRIVDVGDRYSEFRTIPDDQKGAVSDRYYEMYAFRLYY